MVKDLGAKNETLKERAKSLKVPNKSHNDPEQYSKNNQGQFESIPASTSIYTVPSARRTFLVLKDLHPECAQVVKDAGERQLVS
jgi:hypothetical protein